LQARALAKAGYAVLQMDLLGCGDSAGEFGDASWAHWVSDVVHAVRWLEQRHAPAAAPLSVPPLWLWGHRMGALLAVQAAAELASACNFLFWQPAVAGKPLLQQFLRLKSAGQLANGEGKGTVQRLRDDLAAGRSVEVAGYTLHPALCRGMDAALLNAPPFEGYGRRVEWFEVSPTEGAEVSPAALTHAAQWSRRGWVTNTHIVRGPAFWQTSEIEDAPALLQASVQMLTGAAISSAAVSAG
jgi:exosortase A-associated hydrolase 2